MTAVQGAPGAPVDRHRTVAVVGTGTMGRGIAQVALVAGHPVQLHDTAPGRAAQAAGEIVDRLDRLVGKGRMTAADRDAARARLTPAAELRELAGAALVVEAIVTIARGMGKRTIAEFVTEPEAAALLRDAGVDFAQGFHIGRPGPLGEILPAVGAGAA